MFFYSFLPPYAFEPLVSGSQLSSLPNLVDLTHIGEYLVRIRRFTPPTPLKKQGGLIVARENIS